MIEIDIDLRRLQRILRATEQAIEVGLKKGIEEALEYWRDTAQNIAPIGRYPKRRGGRLRANIEPTDVTGSGTDLSGTVVANAHNDGFNYAYYLHEVAPSKGQHAHEPGTVLEFIEKSRDDNEAKLIRIIEQEIREEVERRSRIR